MDDVDRMPPLGAVKPPALWISLKNLWGARCSAGFLAGLGRNRNFTAPQHARPQHSRNAVWLFLRGILRRRCFAVT
jgi:hypothetical protein